MSQRQGWVCDKAKALNNAKINFSSYLRCVLVELFDFAFFRLPLFLLALFPVSLAAAAADWPAGACL
jgi:hypothetical protein